MRLMIYERNTREEEDLGVLEEIIYVSGCEMLRVLGQGELGEGEFLTLSLPSLCYIQSHPSVSIIYLFETHERCVREWYSCVRCVLCDVEAHDFIVT